MKDIDMDCLQPAFFFEIDAFSTEEFILGLIKKTSIPKKKYSVIKNMKNVANLLKLHS